MKTKLELAHEYAMLHMMNPQYKDVDDLEVVQWAWDYVEAMQAEADERNKAEAEQKRKEMREILNADNTFIEREGQHFDDVCGCEVDWRVAPDDATHYVIFADGLAYWYKSKKLECFDIAPSFGIVGMCVVERPDGL